MTTPEYSLPTDAYVNFDATSLKSFMIEKLNESGRFTDQNYEGSNISSILDILAYYTHVLMFYLNQTASESSFSQASIYENMNRIVKLIGYKPTGKQTSMVPIDCVASSSLVSGSYKIPKYSYFLVDNIQYTLINDISFEKVLNEDESIESINNNAILYQGVVGEYPIYTSDGIDYETFPIVVDNLVDTRDKRFISHGTISIYVKESDNNWYEYEEVDSLFLTTSNSRVYETRLNENGHYELKFGNNVFGKKLNSGNEVAVFYILSDGDKGLISKNSINGNKLYKYRSSRFSEIYDNINSIADSEEINESNRSYLFFTNTSNSTTIREGETVEEIRTNAPSYLSTQLRLVTENDYERFLKKALPNILNDVKVVNNTSFISNYISYFYEMCVDPNKVNRVVLNQVGFADSCDFNNINVFCVPHFVTDDEGYPEFLSTSFKNTIRDITQNKKMLCNEVVPRDPVYMAVDIGFGDKKPDKNTANLCKITVVREKNDKTSKETIKNKVLAAINEYFSPSNIKLGQTVDMSYLTSKILSTPGIKNIRTVNTEENIYFNGLSLIIWNPLYENSDIEFLNQTTTLPYFKYPYIYRPNSLINRIEVIDE